MLGIHFRNYYGDKGREKYLTRLSIGRLRLHIFWRGDADPDPHDHPWGFWTFPLHDYVEEVIAAPEESLMWSEYLGVDPGIIKYHQVVQRFRLHHVPATHTHRVLGRAHRSTDSGSPVLWSPHTDPGPIVTIVWREKTSRDWGFLKLRGGRWCWEPWRSYVYEGGKHTMCEPDEPWQGMSRTPADE